jgi:hypothetical protein
MTVAEVSSKTNLSTVFLYTELSRVGDTPSIYMVPNEHIMKYISW